MEGSDKLSFYGKSIRSLIKLGDNLGFSIHKSEPVKNQPKTPRSFYGQRDQIFTWSYDGEKNLGEVGPVRDYTPDYEVLRIRSWQAYIESDVAQSVFKKFKTWIIGKGLKIQSEPEKVVLESEGIEPPSENFIQTIESRFRLYAKNPMSDYCGMNNLHIIADEAYKNAIVGGDVLVVMHYIKNQVKVQLIDGENVKSPTYSSIVRKENGNVIVHGVELDKNGDHVAYHCKFKKRSIKINAFNNNIRVAFMVYGSKYRLDNHRGMPLIAVVLETMKKMERYKEATIGSAEERQKIAIFAEHKSQSTGESPWLERLADVVDVDGRDDVPEDINGNAMADTVAVTTNKQLINLPIDTTLKMLESKNELYFKEFYNTNFEFVCAALEIPPNVAKSLYTDSFSASRAATKEWDHTADIKRENFAFQFYRRVYEFWFHVEVLKNKINAPGYLEAFESGEEMITSAYTNARFIGPHFPHIDPVKEVTAVRMRMGKSGDHLPLMSQEAGTEELNGGDSKVNTERFSEELKRAEKMNIPKVGNVEVSPDSTTEDDNKNDD